MSKMLLSQDDFDVFVYHAGSDVTRFGQHEYVQVVSDNLMAETYGPNFNSTYNQNWSQADDCWSAFCSNARREILERSSNLGDVILVSFGYAHKDAVVDSPLFLPIEMGIGYSGFLFNHRVWESYAWKHFCMSMYSDKFLVPNSFDAVIPGYFDESDFEFSKNKEDYFLFMGRGVKEKGIIDAAISCRSAGVDLVVAGSIGREIESIVKGILPKVHFLGPVSKPERRKLLSKALATFCLSHYVEPFGNVAVESMISGTPVISYDHGAFVETVSNGFSGIRCINLQSVPSAIRFVLDGRIDPEECRARANRFALESVWPMYQSFFKFARDSFTKELGYL